MGWESGSGRPPKVSLPGQGFGCRTPFNPEAVRVAVLNPVRMRPAAVRGGGSACRPSNGSSRLARGGLHSARDDRLFLIPPHSAVARTELPHSRWPRRLPS